jgi:hypothetical protein
MTNPFGKTPSFQFLAPCGWGGGGNLFCIKKVYSWCAIFLDSLYCSLKGSNLAN